MQTYNSRVEFSVGGAAYQSSPFKVKTNMFCYLTDGQD